MYGKRVFHPSPVMTGELPVQTASRKAPKRLSSRIARSAVSGAAGRAFHAAVTLAARSKRRALTYLLRRSITASGDRGVTQALQAASNRVAENLRGSGVAIVLEVAPDSVTDHGGRADVAVDRQITADRIAGARHARDWYWIGIPGRSSVQSRGRTI